MNDRDIGVFFDECARNGYMGSFSPEEEPKLKKLFGLWNIKPGHSILEPGCGSGRLTGRIAKVAAPDGMVYACDLSEEMIQKARARKLPDFVRFVRGSAEQIQADDAFFDMAICFCVFPHFTDPVHVLIEIRRVLKPEGQLWINHLKDRESLNEMHRNASPVIIDHQIPETAEMKRLLTENGFIVKEFYNSPERGYSLQAIKRI